MFVFEGTYMMKCMEQERSDVIASINQQICLHLPTFFKPLIFFLEYKKKNNHFVKSK